MERDRSKKYMRGKLWKRERNLGGTKKDIGRGRNHTPKDREMHIGGGGGKKKENAKGETIEE